MKSSLNLEDPDHFELNQLLEIAHLALDERMFEEAQEMFALLRMLFPSNPHPRIGQALVVYAQHGPADSITLLEDVLRDFPRAVLTRSLLARFLLEANSPDWRKHALAVLAMVSEGVAFDMARTLLQSHAGESGSPLPVTSLATSPANSPANSLATSPATSLARSRLYFQSESNQESGSCQMP